MQTSLAYLYHQRHEVILLDTSGDYFSRRYRQVYTKDLIAHRGTDNQLLIEFVNQDQRYVDVTGKEFTARVISRDGKELLLEKPLEVVNAPRGQMKLVLTTEELDPITPQLASFSIEQTAGNLDEPVYTDESAGARRNIQIVDSIMPEFVPSTELTIPSHAGSPYVSSVLQTEDKPTLTFQFTLDSFVGTIEAEGAADTDGLWYPIDSLTWTTPSPSTALLTITGYHPYLRFTVTESAGTVAKILHR